MDLNNNGVNDFKELADWFKGVGKKILVDLIDTDGDGEVELEEVVTALAKIGYMIVKK